MREPTKVVVELSKSSCAACARPERPKPLTGLQEFVSISVVTESMGVEVVDSKKKCAGTRADIGCQGQLDGASAQTQGRMQGWGRGQCSGGVLAGATVLVAPKDERREPGHEVTSTRRACVR